ncbi:hypothetical protein [Pseudovibrio sp. Tun.PSC04-5.I4]|uniref:hypothetical protein n=1 Tax=Pseudovibrio sp. Tun.PSC04-5.I4 TaxID=1798213 RepID=UPI000B897EE4|nr:hypothetical protein [Pseudovibrio sp. Tun.PSC04-5.I4]
MIFAAEGDLGLLSFFIHNQQQGRDFGKQAVSALKPYLSVLYAGYEGVYLTVNCKNPIAQGIYMKGGFENSGELYWGEVAGPQHVLRMPLR